MGKKDVILIGLGEFGERTLGLLKDILDERVYQMPKELQDKISVHFLVFKDGKTFRYNDVAKKISDEVMETDTRKWSGKFSYVFVGDLYEDITSRFALDYSIVPLILDQNTTVLRNKDEVLGFFTFSDMLGRHIRCTDEKLSDIASFFRKFSLICEKSEYKPQFKDASGDDFPSIACPLGSFTRNYILVTPGDQNSVMNMTSQVFAERIFYEMFYLSDEYKDIVNSIQPRRVAERGKNFCGFTMVQISRLSELQKYFLKYTLEDKVLEFLLNPRLLGTNLDAFEDKFFKMMDIPRKSGFPIELATDIFIKHNKSSVTHLFPSYIGKGKRDFKDYIQDCRKKIDARLSELTDNYDGFAKSEMEYMLSQLEEGWKKLFRINRLTGNISTYIKYVEDVKATFESWTDNLKSIVESQTEFSLDESLDAVEKKIQGIQASPLYKIPFFIPVRRILIENAIMSLPLKDYLRSKIKKNIANAFLVQWANTDSNTRNPIGICDELVRNLNTMMESLKKKKQQVVRKKEFIRNVPSYYYIISQNEQKEYSELLERIESDNFGPAKITKIEEIARKLFNDWTNVNGVEKKRQKITNSSSSFVSFIDERIEAECASGFGETEEDGAQFNRFASFAVEEMRRKAETSSASSFFTENSANYLEMQKILVRPELSNSDELEQRLDDMNDIHQTVKVKNEFTLGSVAYFQDYLYMGYENLQHYHILFKRYANDDIKEYEYADDVIAPTPETEEDPVASHRSAGTVPSAEDLPLTETEEIVRALLLDYCEDFARVYMYKASFPDAVTGLSDEEILAKSESDIDSLSRRIRIADLLEGLDDDKLRDFAKDFDFPLVSDREGQLNLILHKIGEA